jgi:6-phosphogluconolactonase (cycloisomerase 2 family)
MMQQLGGSRILKTVGASLAVGLGMTACSRDYTSDYLYVTCATKTNQSAISSYAVDYQAGALTPLADSPTQTNGSNAVALVASPNQKFLYAINNAAPSSNIQPFEIGTDGKLYPGQAVPVVQNPSATIIGSLPTAIAIDPTGSFLYVTFTYQQGYSPTSPGPGGVAVYPIDPSTGAVGSPVMNGSLPYFATGDNPMGVVVDPKNDAYVYVIDQEQVGTPTAHGVLLTYARNKTTGALTQLVVTGANTVDGGLQAGTTPAGIAEDPGSNFIYVTDEVTNQLYGFLATGGLPTAAGTPPLAMVSSPFTTGSVPLGVTVDPRGEYVYVANFNSSTVSAFAINVATGALSSVAGSAGTSVATGPTCVTIDPALGIYAYTSNNVDGSVSGLQLNPHTGALTPVQGTKFVADALPTCAVAVGNGAHATQVVQ